MDQRDFQKLCHLMNGLDDTIPIEMTWLRWSLIWWWKITEPKRFQHRPTMLIVEY